MYLVNLLLDLNIKKLHIVHHDDMATFFKPWSNHYALNVHRLGQLVGYVADSYVFGHIPGEVDDGDE